MHHRKEYINDTSILTEYGSRILFLHKNQTDLLLSFGFPPKNSGYYIPSGLTLISDGEITENRAFSWEGRMSIDKFYQFAPDIMLSSAFFESLVNLSLNDLDPSGYIFIIISILGGMARTEINIIDKNEELDGFETHKFIPIPFIYRKFEGKIFGRSMTTIKTSQKTISLYEPLPPFCSSSLKRLKSTCSLRIKRKTKTGIYFNLTVGNTSQCSIEYGYRCAIPRSEYGPNGVFVGPDVVFYNGNKSYGNHVRIIFPEFSPRSDIIFILAAGSISLSFALILKNIRKQRIKKTKEN